MFPFTAAQEEKKLQALHFSRLEVTHGVPSPKSIILSKCQGYAQTVGNHSYHPVGPKDRKLSTFGLQW